MLDDNKEMDAGAGVRLRKRLLPIPQGRGGAGGAQDRVEEPSPEAGRRVVGGSLVVQPWPGVSDRMTRFFNPVLEGFLRDLVCFEGTVVQMQH